MGRVGEVALNLQFIEKMINFMLNKYVLGGLVILVIVLTLGLGVKYGCYGRSHHQRDVPLEEFSITVE